MPATEPVATAPPRPGSYTAAQRRVIAAAGDLFPTFGVSGTSLQMIADAAGITKASVYYQFKTKEEIVIAVAEEGMAPLEIALDRAEAADDRAEALDGLLVELIDLAVERRRMVTLLENDPVVVKLIAQHEPFRTLMDRLYRLLAGDDDLDGRLPAAMLSAAINGAVIHPLVADLDDDTLRANLLDLARRFLGLPGSTPAVPLVGLVAGNPKPRSRTLDVGRAVAHAAASAAGLDGADQLEIDLAEVAPLLFDWSSPAVRDLVSSVSRCSLLVVASPTFKASYTGLLKSFLDWFGTTDLAGVVTVPVMVGAAPSHALAVEVHLRPVLVEIGATLPVRGLYVTEADLERLDDVIARWVTEAGPVLRRALARPS